MSENLTKHIKFVSKGWGYEKIIDNNSLYCGKLLYVVKHLRGSIHYHKLKKETFYLHSGKVEIRYHDSAADLEEYVKNNGTNKIYDVMEKVILRPGDTFRVPPGKVHQIIGLQDSELFEFSTEDFTDDSYRIVKGD